MEHDRSKYPAQTDRDLRRDLRMLRFEWSGVLRRHGEPGLFERVRKLRALADRRRQGNQQAEQQLIQMLGELDDDQLGQLIRALGVYFDLANLAEDRHRIRVLRQRERLMHPAPRDQSIAAAINELAEAGHTADQMQRLIDDLQIELVFTAHPTEAKRRTVRQILARLRGDLMNLQSPDNLPRERERLFARIRADLACLYETESFRPTKPTVLDEVGRGLATARTAWQIAPQLYRDARTALRNAYPHDPLTVRPFVRFGSWIGGDRDGNPFVTAEVTADTLNLLRRAAIDKHIEQADELSQTLTLSNARRTFLRGLSLAVEQAVERWPDLARQVARLNPHELYRHWLAVIKYRLAATAAVNRDGQNTDAAYQSPDQLLEDLHLISRSLAECGYDDLAAGQLQDWIDRTEAFGFQLARLDIREDARQLAEVVSEIGRALGLAEPGDQPLDAEQRQAMVSRTPLKIDRSLYDRLSAQACETLALFELIEKSCRGSSNPPVACFVISMTRSPADVLSVQWLAGLAAKLAAQNEPVALPVVPLFETIDDLQRADLTLDRLMRNPAYADNVRRTGNVQTCMVGYSDSTKDGGYLAACWELYGAQRRLANVACEHHFELVIFHGRGGSLGRGGGPAARGILSLPPESLRGRIRITEQGEVLAQRYDEPEIARRHIEQVTYATMHIAARPSDEPDPQWMDRLDRAARAGFDAYRQLIEDPGFVTFFRSATPINIIEGLPIGSRPARRRSQQALTDLRAIPYTFAWTQSRAMLTAFYGLGSGLEAARNGDWSTWQRMYDNWPIFHAIIDNAEFALIKADMWIAGQYARLGGDDAQIGRLHQMIRDEYQRTVNAVLAIKQQDRLMAGTPWLARSILDRNPSIDPLNLIQVELMHRLNREQFAKDDPVRVEQLKRLLRKSVQAIASGMRTTG